jgi:hypothetical protein
MMKPAILNRNDGRTVTFGPCRLSYTHLFNKYAGPDGDESRAKYQTGILIPKSQKETITALKKCIKAAYDQAVTKYWNGKKPSISEDSDAYPLRDGDGKDDENYEGCVYLNAKSGRKPSVTDKNGDPIMDEDEIYSGVWAWVCVTFYGYKVNGKCGVATAIEAVRKCKDDEQFGGGVSQTDAFGNIGIDEEDDDDL